MNEYYGSPTTPTTDYLAHYGIKGMKWGVRKAIERGNTRALSRQFRKAERKLAKLKAKADSQALLKKANQLDKVARGAAGIGTIGLGAAGAGTASSIIQRKRADKNFDTLNKSYNASLAEAQKYSGASSNKGKAMYEAAMKDAGGYEKQIADTARNYQHARDISRGVQAGGAGLAALGYGTAIGAKLRARSLRRRAGNVEKMRAARQEAANFQREMNRAFAGTQYARNRKRRRG